MTAQGKWEATISRTQDKSYISRNAHRVPINGLDFEGENGEVMVYMMATCPGIFNGDEQTISVILEEDAHLFLTDSSPTELHPSGTKDPMNQTMTFKLQRGSTLEYLPETLIPFKDSNYKGKTTVYMESGAQAFLSEMVAAGRIGRNEFYEYIGLETRFKVYWNEELKVSDVIRLDPSQGLTRKAVLDDYTHFGSVWMLSEQVTDAHLEYIRQHILNDCEGTKVYGGTSLLNENGLVVRLLGYSSESLQSYIQKVWDYFREQCLHISPMEVLK